MVVDDIIRRYCQGDKVSILISETAPPLTTYSFYKILKANNVELRGQISRREVVPKSVVLKCRSCNRDKLAEDFSKHGSTMNGFDTSSCKQCKVSKHKWSNVSIQKRIFNRIKSRASRKNIEFNLELSDIIIPEKCPVYNHIFIYNDTDWTYSVDRIDNSKGYTKENIQIISNKANRLKNNASVEDIEILLNWMKLTETRKET